MRKLMMTTALATMLAAIAAGAQAQTVDWTLSGVTFNGGADSLSGWFEFNTSSDSLTAWDITESGGSNVEYTSATGTCWVTHPCLSKNGGRG